MTELRRPVPLDLQRHQRAAFDCGEPSLDEWLIRHAGQSRRSDTAATWVIADTHDVVVAYASLSMTAVDLHAAPRRLGKNAPDPIPALLVGRLAVDRRFSRLGIGTELVKHVLATALDINAKAACRSVVVTALHLEARSWWERFGFLPMYPDDPEGLDLYMLTKDILVTVGSLGADGPS